MNVIDIVQPPARASRPSPRWNAHRMIVPAALAAKSSAETPKKACWETRAEGMGRETSRNRSALVVLVMAAPPDARLIAAVPEGKILEDYVVVAMAGQADRTQEQQY
jgi:hypothetical protein